MGFRVRIKGVWTQRCSVIEKEPLRSNPAAHDTEGVSHQAAAAGCLSVSPSAAAAAVWAVRRWMSRYYDWSHFTCVLRRHLVMMLLLLQGNRRVHGYVLLNSADGSCEERLKDTALWEFLEHMSHPPQKPFWPLMIKSGAGCLCSPLKYVLWQAEPCVSVKRDATFQLPSGYRRALGSCEA